jgi:hypothetical protein
MIENDSPIADTLHDHDVVGTEQSGQGSGGA